MWYSISVHISGALDKSIDELVGNDLKHIFKEECGDNTKTMKKRKIYTGLAKAAM